MRISNAYRNGQTIAHRTSVSYGTVWTSKIGGFVDSRLARLSAVELEVMSAKP